MAEISLTFVGLAVTTEGVTLAGMSKDGRVRKRNIACCRQHRVLTIEMKVSGKDIDNGRQNRIISLEAYYTVG